MISSLLSWMEPEQKNISKFWTAKASFRLGLGFRTLWILYKKKPTSYKRCPTGPDPNAKILEVVAAHLRQRQNWDMAGRVQDVLFWTPQNWGFLGFCQILEATRNGGIVFFWHILKDMQRCHGWQIIRKKNTTAIDNPLGMEFSLPTRHILVSYMNLVRVFSVSLIS